MCIFEHLSQAWNASETSFKPSQKLHDFINQVLFPKELTFPEFQMNSAPKSLLIQI